jgi:diketogulonate reductase-like aldo/keto reductase
MFTNPTLADIGERHGKSVAQVILRFLIQSDVMVIPKNVNKERMAQNLDVFDFTLDDADMQVVRGLDEEQSAFVSHYDPETVERLTGFGNPKR